MQLEAELAYQLSARLVQNGVKQEVADSVAQEVATDLCDYLALTWGGQQLYLPKDHKRRAALICKEFTGGNHAELASKYNISLPHVYRILKQGQQKNNLKGGKAGPETQLSLL